MRRPGLALAALAALAALGWMLFHPDFRPDPDAISPQVRQELDKTGFKSTQGVASAEFETVESLDGQEEKGVNRQKLVAIDALLTEKRSRRQWSKFSDQSSGLYVGPFAAVRFSRGWPPLLGDLLPYAFWAGSRITEFAVDERHEFPHASGGRLLARVTYEDRFADGELVQTERRRVRCDVEKLVDAASIHPGLAGQAALVRCAEKLEKDGRRTGPKHPGTYVLDEDVRYAHWYVLDRGWSIALEGEIGVRINDAPEVRKWRSRLLSFEAK